MMRPPYQLSTGAPPCRYRTCHVLYGGAVRWITSPPARYSTGMLAKRPAEHVFAIALWLLTDG